MLESLAFGHGVVPLSWPRGVDPEVIVPEARAAALEGPVLDLAAEAGALAASLPLVGHGRVLVLVPDRSRPFPLSDVLPPLLHALERRGVSPRSITVAIASGTHRAADADVSRSRLGELPGGVCILRHDPDAPGADFGTTPAGTPVRVNGELARADVIVALGPTAFHYFAGFGGGWKLPFPGLGEREAVAANHRRSLGSWPPGGLAAGVEPGRLDTNPVARDLRDAAERLPPVHHLTLWPAVRHGYAGGRWRDLAAFAELCARYRAPRTVGEAHAYDVVVASAGGWPRDLDAVQAHKTLFHAARYVRPGGSVVLVAACDEGLGSHAFERWLLAPDLDTLEENARTHYDLNAQTAISLGTLARRVRVRWVARRPLPDLARWGPAFTTDVGSAVTEACAEAWGLDGRPPRVAVLPVATDVLPGAALTGGRHAA